MEKQMFKINEASKTVEYVELWHMEDVKYIYESDGIYTESLTEEDFFNILKNAMRKAERYDCKIDYEMIETCIDEYIEEKEND
jgi:hypothetical protein